MAKPYFLQIVVQCKSIPDNDWRAFLYWANPEEMLLYEIRGYGESPGEAAEDAYEKFNEDADFYSVEQGEWK